MSLGASSASIDQYRPDIDGLRAIAVAAVVLYHAGASIFPGGFIGVDVFFVISGYLISGIIREECQAGRWSLRSFYYRRFYRIAPALCVVLLLTLVAGYFLLFPIDYRALAKQTGYSLVFLINFYFKADQAGYFHNAAELQPLLHLWSLSVEEQFYVFWPLLMIFAIRRKLEGKFLLIVCTLSFMLSCWLVMSGGQNTAFYILPSRAWELGVGAAIAACTLRYRECVSQGWRGHVLSVFGLVLICLAIFYLDRHSSFPGWNALLPTLGAGCLILAGPHALINRFVLARRWPVALGLRSYALYLWHWPLLAYARVIHVGDLPANWAFAMVVIALIGASLAYRFVEHPIRAWSRKKKHRSSGGAGSAMSVSEFVWWPIVAMVVLPAAMASAIFSFGGLPLRFPQSVLDDLKSGDQVRNEQVCEGRYDQTLKWSDNCKLAGQQKLAVVWGDSHAGHYFPGLAAYATSREMLPVLLSTPSCPPLPGVERIDDSRRCAKAAQAGYDWMIGDDRVREVFIAARFAAYGDGRPLGFDRTAQVRLVSIDGNNDPSQKALFERTMGASIRGLVAAGKRVIVMGEVPQQLMDIPNCEGRKKFYSRFFSDADCELPINTYQERAGWLNVYLQSLENAIPGLCVFRPEALLCDQTSCRVRADGEIIYSDNNHLNLHGSIWMASHYPGHRCFP